MESQLLVSPPSKDPLKLHSFPTKEKGIIPTFYQVTTQGFSEDHCAKAQEETAEYHAKNAVGKYAWLSS